MTAKIVYFYAVTGLADWEPGLALAELASGRFFKAGVQPYGIKTCALENGPVRTMGGVHIVPDCLVGDIALQDAALLLLPGSNDWLEPVHAPILKKVVEFLNAGVPVAAICGATFALANAGILNDRLHTSNALQAFKMFCPGYAGEANYREAPAVTDRDLITAGATDPVAFAYHILKRLDVFSEETLALWHTLFTTGDPEVYPALMDSVPAR
jgi:putative intracellular protease/amidase